MFDFLYGRGSTTNPDAARDAIQPQRSWNNEVINIMSKEISDLQKIVDALCKVYVAQHAKEIDGRHPDEKWHSTDQPIIDRAKVMELERKIRTAQADLDSLTTEYRSYR